MIRFVVLETTPDVDEQVWFKTFNYVADAKAAMIEEAKKYDGYEGYTEFPMGISSNDITWSAHRVKV